MTSALTFGENKFDYNRKIILQNYLKESFWDGVQHVRAACIVTFILKYNWEFLFHIRIWFSGVMMSNTLDRKMMKIGEFLSWLFVVSGK